MFEPFVVLDRRVELSRVMPTLARYTLYRWAEAADVGAEAAADMAEVRYDEIHRFQQDLTQGKGQYFEISTEEARFAAIALTTNLMCTPTFARDELDRRLRLSKELLQNAAQAALAAHVSELLQQPLRV